MQLVGLGLLTSGLKCLISLQGLPVWGLCCFEQCVSDALMFQEEEPFESTSEDESGAEDRPNPNPVVDVEDLGRIVSCAKREKVASPWERRPGPCGWLPPGSGSISVVSLGLLPDSVTLLCHLLTILKKILSFLEETVQAGPGEEDGRRERLWSRLRVDLRTPRT